MEVIAQKKTKKKKKEEEKKNKKKKNDDKKHKKKEDKKAAKEKQKEKAEQTKKKEKKTKKNKEATTTADKKNKNKQRVRPGEETLAQTHKATKDLPAAEIPASDIQLLKRLGKGCFGEVWRGECHAAQVAVKVPLIQKLNEAQLEALRSEITIMAGNPHTNIVLLMGACTTTPGKFQIVTELMDGDVEKLLHSPQGKNMSLFERLVMAKDAALGMTWLHCTEPAVIHRDLKTANLLYKRTGNSYVIKVCDFGLSAIKPDRVKNMRNEEGDAPGTPLYMAPEVMEGREYNEKADVYSFGIILWEIYTCKEPFPHHDDYDVFQHAVCVKGERPKIDRACMPSLRRLMEDCWHADQTKRPDFLEINSRLDAILVEAAIDDPEGRIFWCKYFLKNHSVSWDKFSQRFYKFLGLERPEYKDVTAVSSYLDRNNLQAAAAKERAEQNGEEAEEQASLDEVTLRCLRAIVAQPEPGESQRTEVDIQWFGMVLQWFGPLHRQVPEGELGFLDNLREMLSRPWFHGDVEMEDAQLRLNGAPPGTFLVRFSRQKGAYAITRVSEGGSIGNIRIARTSQGLSVSDDKHYATLDELIADLGDKLHLITACGGSRFLPLFEDAVASSGYEFMG
ncbi:serine/threonine-protein kinase STY17 isoform X1 [Balamuthia mandrillaris]